MEKQNVIKKKLKLAIVILAILLSVSVMMLAGTLIVSHFTHTSPGTVEVPGNIITPEGESSADAGRDDPSADLPDKSPGDESADEPNPSESPESSGSNPPAFQPPESSSVSGTKASAISLHSKQPEENTPFQTANMFPGDNETRYYRIRVSYKGDIIVRYHADIRPGYEKLAEVLKVKIRLPGEDKLLYDGLMRDMPESLNHKLYTTEKTQSELYYEITAYLDASVGNEYQNKNLIADFRWWVQETRNLDSPPTDDNPHLYLWIALASGSLFLLMFLFVKRRKEAAADER